MDGNKERPEVAFIAQSIFGAVGGIQKFNQRIISSVQNILSSTGSRIIFFGINDRLKDIPDWARSSFLTPQRYRLGSLYQLLVSCKTAKVLLLGHINLLPLAMLAKLSGSRAKIVLFGHGVEIWADDRYRLKRAYDDLLLRLIDKICIVSRYSADRFLEKFKFPPERVCILPNAIDVPSGARERVIYHDSRPKRIILTVSRLSSTEKEKNIDKVILSLPAILAIIPDVVLMIVGDGALKDNLIAMAADLGVSKNVVFTGKVDNEELISIYNQAAIFCLPSTKEGFGIVYLEAWLHGMPVIAANQGVALELIQDGVDGLLVNGDSPSAIANACVRLLCDDELRASLSGAGYLKAVGNFSHEVFTRNLQEILMPFIS